jgi:hypothetical protein
VLEGARVGADAGDVHAALMGEGVAADERLVRIRRDVEQLVDEVGDSCEPRELFVRDALVAELELQVRQDRGQVGVAGALADAVHRPLNEAGALVHGRQGVRDGALEVVVRVDPDRHVECLHHRLRRLGDLEWQARAVGVAECDVLGSGVRGGLQALERVAGVVAVAVEEVLGVVDHPLARLRQVGDRILDHRQVLLAAHLGDLLQVEPPGLPDQCHDGREAAGEELKRLVLGGLGVATAGHAERADRGLPKFGLGEHLEELEFLGVRAGEARLDEVDAELVELGDHAHLLLRGEGHALALHAVPQSRVVEEYLCHRCLSSFVG